MHTPSQTFSFPHTRLRTQVLALTLHVLRRSCHVPSTSCHSHTDPRMNMFPGACTRMCMQPSHTPYLREKKKPQAPTCMRCHRHRQQAPPTPVCTSITLTHTLTSAHILVFTLKSSPGSKTQTLKRCLSLDALPALSLHMPTGLHTYAALPTETGFYPPSPPTYRLLLQSHTFPHRNPPSTCTPTHMTSDMSTPEIYCFALSPPTCTHKLLR